MKRRDFITLIGGAAAMSPLAVRAQQPRRISILHSGFPNRTPIHLLFAALRTLGYEDGRTAAIELLGGEGDLPGSMRSSPNSPAIPGGYHRPDRPYRSCTPASRRDDAGRVRLCQRSGRARHRQEPSPSGRKLHRHDLSDAVLGGKRLELLMDMLPGLQRVAVIWSRDFAGNSAIFGAIRAAAPAHRVELFPRLIRGADDLTSAFDDAKASGAQAAIFMTDNVLPDAGRKLPLWRLLAIFLRFIPLILRWRTAV